MWIQKAKEELEEHRARIRAENDKKYQVRKVNPGPQDLRPQIKEKKKQNDRDKCATKSKGKGRMSIEKGTWYWGPSNPGMVWPRLRRLILPAKQTGRSRHPRGSC
jgi:hypothetical protein